MNPKFEPSSRRSFVKKSLAAGIAASQPVFLSGLIRASGEGAGSVTKEPGTTCPYTSLPQTTDPYGLDTTVLETTIIPETTIVPNTTFFQYY